MPNFLNWKVVFHFIRISAPASFLNEIFTHMALTTEERLIEAMRMIEETRDYLRRLPAVPVTYEHISRMTAFLNAPDNDLLIKRNVPRRGAYRTPAGVPVISAELRGDTLRVWQRDRFDSRTHMTDAQREECITIKLSLDEKID